MLALTAAALHLQVILRHKAKLALWLADQLLLI
jgi:hypothetical protein